MKLNKTKNLFEIYVKTLRFMFKLDGTLHRV